MIEPFNAVDLIIVKRDGGELAAEEIRWLVDAYLRGVVADEQMSAFLMAVALRGMGVAETAALTDAYVASGTRLEWSGLARPTVDKHSTGGVGDKVTLPLTPLVAALGAAVPQLSGRGLGHTGGTLDKLESIPGFTSLLSPERMRAVLAEAGGMVCAASDDLAPADRRLYALRDVTGTVESIPLIAASIMSKKIAEGTGALVLDVKVGRGAFMKNESTARELATVMVELGESAGVRTRALVTGMDTPIGNTAGNALEVAESLEVLAGGGPADLVELVTRLAEEMLDLAGLDASHVRRALGDGTAMDSWRRMIRAQGGDPDAALPRAPIVEVLTAPVSGRLSSLDAYKVGVAAWRLGAGRARKEDPVDHAAGVRWLARPGDNVTAGTPLFELHCSEASRIPGAAHLLEEACSFDGHETPRPLFIDTVG